MIKSKTRGAIAMGIGALLIFAAIFLILRNSSQENESYKFVDNTILSLDRAIRVNAAGAAKKSDVSELLAAVPETDGNGALSEAEIEMETLTVDNIRYVGEIYIPMFELKLPVLADYNLEQMRLAPCKYSGSIKNDTLVICGHNYTKHFGRLSSMATGDSVIFIDANGTEHKYTVSEIDTLSRTSVDEMKTGDWDLTLFTCDYSGQNRVTIRCERAQ